MIYRALFGSVPPPLLSSQYPITQGVVDQILGYYRTTGAVVYQDRSGVKYVG